MHPSNPPRTPTAASRFLRRRAIPAALVAVTATAGLAAGAAPALADSFAYRDGDDAEIVNADGSRGELVIDGSAEDAASAPVVAAASEPPRYRTTVEATDDTDFTLRSGSVGDRCSSWGKVEGHVVTTIRPVRWGDLLVFDPPGPVGVLLTHSLLKSRIAARLRTSGTQHAAFPCGCGPNSELGRCPTEEADKKLNGDCGRNDPGAGTLGLMLRKRKLFGLAGARIEMLLEDCPLARPDLLPNDMGLPAEVPLPASALRDIRRLQPGASTELRETFKHAGKDRGCPRRTVHLPDSVCGVFTFAMKVERIR
jgi:hypothetical protein